MSLQFMERLVFAEDRGEKLKELTPGSEEQAFHALLQLQTEGKIEDAKLFLKNLSCANTTRMHNLRMRNWLLEWERANKSERTAILKELRERLSLSFNHSKQVTRLDERVGTSGATMLKDEQWTLEFLGPKMLKMSGPEKFTQLAHPWLSTQAAQMKEHNFNRFMRALSSPHGIAGLPALLARHMKEQKLSFGSLGIHRQLTCEQLKKLLSIDSSLKTRQDIVIMQLKQLIPPTFNPDTADFKEKEQVYQTGWDFATRLPALFNSLKLNLMYHLLEFQSKHGVYDMDRFTEYVKLPLASGRFAFYEYYKNAPQRASFGTHVDSFFSRVNNHDALLVDFLTVFFTQKDDINRFRKYLNNKQLERVLAETKLQLHGAPPKDKSMTKWITLLQTAASQHAVEALKEKTVLAFPKQNQIRFGVGERVVLEVQLKRVPSLSVKVFEINTKGYYQTKKAEIPDTIDLDGLTPHVEFEKKYAQLEESPFLCLKDRIELPMLTGRRGVFVVEFLGVGLHLRAIVRKGRYRFLQRETIAGHVFRLYDEDNKQIEDGTIWMDGHTYTADEKGEIYLPFCASNTSRTILLSKAGDEFTSLVQFQHKTEQYNFAAGIYVDREALMAKANADVVIRPAVYLNGRPSPLALLKNVTLKITTVDSSKTSTTKAVNDFKLQDNEESVYSFSVPDDLRTVTFTLSASVSLARTGEKRNLSVTKQFSCNRIDESSTIDDCFLRFGSSGYVLVVLGKAGEPRPFRRLNLSMRHKLLRDTQQRNLQTDWNGRVLLGSLEYFHSVTVNGEGIRTRTFTPFDEASGIVRVPTIHAKQGAPFALPLTGRSEGAQGMEWYGVYLTRFGYGGVWLEDLTSKVQCENGYLTFPRTLPAGRYDLYVRHYDKHIPIRIEEGDLLLGRFVVNPARKLSLELGDFGRSPPLQITGAAVQADTVEVQLAQHTQNTRVHLLAAHFFPEFGLREAIECVHSAALTSGTFPAQPRSSFLQSRRIGDEHRYILDRRAAQKFVGNMLERPSLLLNPKVRQETSFEQEADLFGGDVLRSANREDLFAPECEPCCDELFMMCEKSRDEPRQSVAGFTGMEFVASTSACLYNLKPDAHGVIKVPRAKFRPGQSALLVVATDRRGLSYCHASRLLPLLDIPVQPKADKEEEKAGLRLGDPTAYVDTRLPASLDTEKHFSEHHLITVLKPEEKLTIHDARDAKVVYFDCLQDLFSVFTTMASGQAVATLKEFDWLAHWPTLDQETKLKKFSEYSCHELNFFLFKRDPEFFEAVVKPFLAHKLRDEQDFMDRWLLGETETLSEFLHLERFHKLNAVEQLLLALRLPEHGVAICRSIVDRYRRQRPDQKAFVSRFKTALQSKSLEPGKGGAREAALKLASEERMKAEAYKRRRVQEEMKESCEEVKRSSCLMPLSSKVMTRVPPKKPAPRQSKKKGKRMDRGFMDFEKMDEGGEEEEAFGAIAIDGLMAKRDEQRQLFRAPPTTKEYEERGYYLFHAGQRPSVPCNGLWADVAQDIIEKLESKEEVKEDQFISPNVAEGTSNFSEMVFALAWSALPFHATSPTIEVSPDGNTAKYTARSGLLFFHKEMKETPTESSSIAVTQNYFDPVDPYRETEDGRVDKNVVEFFPSKTYKCRVVLTNVSSATQNVEIPEGALPVGGGAEAAFRTRTVFVSIGAYNTKKLEYSFYFPALGDYNHFPVHIAKHSKVVGFGQARMLPVVTKATTPPDLTSWAYVSQQGTEEQVLDFLKSQNIHKVDLSMIAWRMRTGNEPLAFFKATTNILRSRFVFHHTLWSYAFHHIQKHVADVNLEKLLGEFFQNNATIRGVAMPFFSSSLVRVDAYADGDFRHLEYSPLLNARAHMLPTQKSAKDLNLLNRQLKEQYRKFLNYLLHRWPSLQRFSAEHLMAASYYMLLQDRTPRAKELHARINAEFGARGGLDTSGLMQYHYLTAYLAFFDSEVPPTRSAAVREAVAKFRECPVQKKRRLFRDVELQLAEIEEGECRAKAKPVAKTAPKDLEGEGARGVERKRQEEMSALAKSEPSVTFVVEEGTLVVDHVHVKTLRARFYLMDLELLFSTNPFIEAGSSENSKFLFVKPNKEVDVACDVSGQTRVEIPAELRNSNVFIQVVAVGELNEATHTEAHYAHSLTIQMLENYGQLKVSHRSTGVPLPKTYVKVYAKLKDGKTDFYKDGYTDWRGRFDYASLSMNKLPNVELFSVLIMSDKNGAVVRAAKPPAS